MCKHFKAKTYTSNTASRASIVPKHTGSVLPKPITAKLQSVCVSDLEPASTVVLSAMQAWKCF